MDQNTANEIHEIFRFLNKLDYINPDEIPNIDIYMDQVTTFMDEHLAVFKRNDNDKILTKTMINNYTKSGVLPPPIKKKYTSEHMYLLIFLYYFKNVLSISDIQEVLSPLNDRFYGGKSETMDIEGVYRSIFKMEQEQMDNLTKDVIRRLTSSKKLFAEVEDPEERMVLSRFALICMLAYDAYIKRHIIHQIIDNMSNEDERTTDP